MASAGDEGPTAAGGSAAGYGHLPWQQIPKFVPGTTNLDDYTQRLKFIKELWPADSIQHLGPRAALQVEGSAFQKISRIAPEKLRSEEGVKLIVEALGGAWGKTAVEEKFHFFEQAIFQVSQKNDETNDSYLARHDAFFEELLARKVTMEEVRAYVLLRHSQLAPEDKKRVVIESEGNLKYKETVKAIRLLGSKIFGDLQNKSATGSRGLERNKIYDVHYTEESGAEDVFYSAVPEEEPNDEDLLCYFLDINDEDAIYITEFEDSIVDAIQDSELAPVYVTYQEARQRLREKAKARGYWPAKGRGKTKGSGKKGKGTSSSSFPGWGTGRNRSLADRIANSTCRICHQKGHWKRECPRRVGQEGNESKVEVTHFTQETWDLYAQNLPEILHTVPPESEPYFGEEDRQEARRIRVPGVERIARIHSSFSPCLAAIAPKGDFGQSWKENLAQKLLMLARKHRRCTAATSRQRLTPRILTEAAETTVLRSSKPGSDGCDEVALVVTAGAEGVLDTGASRTVVGSQRVREILEGLDAECRNGVRKTSSDIVFRFGNSGTLQSKHALLLPISESAWIRVEVIPGNTLLSCLYLISCFES